MLDGTLLLRDHNNPKVRRAVDSGYTFQYVYDPSLSLCPLVVYAQKDGDYAGSATFNLGNTMTPDGCVQDHAFAQDVGVQAEHQRTGVATAMYVLAEIVLRVPLKDGWDYEGSPQKPDAKALWAQPDRPFGQRG